MITIDNNKNKKMKKETKIKKFFTIQNGQWKEANINSVNISWHWINLYDDDLTIKGIGMYERSNTKN